MRRALREALRGDPSPNPYVGAAIVRDGRVVALGYHARAGQAHAEVDAIRRAGDVRGATLYVTFEPCNHVGRTGPCTEAILAAGIARVVIGCRDPHPHVPGAIERLRENGVEVEVGVLGDECEALVTDFVKHLTTKRPWVLAKAAITLDGRLATASGDSKWITGERARAYGHRLRSRSDAILVGIGTVLADDPELTVRHVDGRNPLRIVLDTRLRIPTSSKLVATARTTRTLVMHGPGAPPTASAALSDRGVELAELPLTCGRVSLEAALDAIGERDVVRLLVEGGPSVLHGFFERGLVDRLAAFVAPKIAGDPAAKILDVGVSARRMDEALTLERVRVRRLGVDVLVEGDVPSKHRPGGSACSPA